MLKLYRSAITPGLWVAYGLETGWVFFPMTVDGWEHRRPARGLDPMHLREVPARLAARCGMPAEMPHMPLPHAA
jgi:hypothetical protein